MWPPITHLSRRLLHFFLPRTCVSCGRDLTWDSTEYLCAQCLPLLVAPGPLFCQRCGVNLPSGGAYCYACRGSKAKKYACSVIRSAWVFNTASRALVHGLKYSYSDYLAPGMGRQMARRFSSYVELSEAEVVIPVPLFAAKKRKRGYNQSELLARSFAQGTGLALLTDALLRTRDTRSQTQLGRTARWANMNGAFVCRCPQKIKRKTILLIDDVATTGATLEGCAQALKKAGAKRVLAYTYAREN